MLRLCQELSEHLRHTGNSMKNLSLWGCITGGECKSFNKAVGGVHKAKGKTGWSRMEQRAGLVSLQGRGCTVLDS